ncbi:MAG: DUF2189 domain-containing protein [Beijerinckiaceae bacterium]|nr:DUF2189 domain-containing protein [Beijerinckiaceae bacterium]
MVDDEAAATVTGSGEHVVIRKLTTDDLVTSLGLGLRDFKSAPRIGLLFGGVYAVGGMVVVALIVALGMPYLGYPLTMGFALIAPFICAGTYEVSRRRERGAPVTWDTVVGAVWRRRGKDLGWLALVTAFTLIIWVDFAVFLFLLFYGLHIPSIPELVVSIFTTTQGFAFAVIGNLAGAVIAFFVFSITVVSVPMLTDRDVDFITAMTTSVRCVIANPFVMMVWAALIGFLLGLSILSGLIGLFVILPVLGHASWHLYRRVVGGLDPALATSPPSS